MLNIKMDKNIKELVKAAAGVSINVVMAHNNVQFR